MRKSKLPGDEVAGHRTVDLSHGGLQLGLEEPPVRSQKVTRHFVTLGHGRQVHYRRCGEGPPVLVLHQSPSTSREQIPLMRTLAAQGFTAIAPDTPGNGLSDPLPNIDVPVMPDFADAVLELMSALRIDRCPIYGLHTGGICAVSIGRLHPDRVTVAVMDGYIQLTDEERVDFLENYLPPLTLCWTGSHLTWAWARMREQVIFFPWYSKKAADRMLIDLPAPNVIHDWVMDLFRAGDDYRKAYMSAFTYDTRAAVQSTPCKTVVMTAVTDILSPYMARMPAVPAHVTCLRPPSTLEAHAAAVEAVCASPSPHAGKSVPATAAIKGRLWSAILQVDGLSVYCRRSTEGRGRPILFIHDTSESSRCIERFMTPLVGERPLLAIDLPGNGESDRPAQGEVTVQEQAKFLVKAIAEGGYSEVDIFAERGGCTVGTELARLRPDIVRHLAIPYPRILDPVVSAEHRARCQELMQLDELGAHWIRAWNMLRDEHLFEPRFSHSAKHILQRGDPDIAPEIIHRRTLDLFKCADVLDSIYESHCEYPLLSELEQVRCPVLLSQEFRQLQGDRCGTLREVTYVPFPRDVDAASRILLKFFS